jgi:hypothetical protein
MSRLIQESLSYSRDDSEGKTSEGDKLRCLVRVFWHSAPTTDGHPFYPAMMVAGVLPQFDVKSPFHLLTFAGGFERYVFSTVMLEMEKPKMDSHDPNDPVAVYVLEVSQAEPLTKMEETKLFRELGHSGGRDQQKENAERRLIESQLMLVVSIAQKHSASSVPMLDLIQEGNIGLMNAIRSFAERPIGDFTAHAAACIEDAITKVLGKST